MNFNLARALLAAGILLPGFVLRAQATDPVYVVTYVDIKPALSREGLGRIRHYVRGSRGDAGNESIQALEELDRAGRFVILEAWRDTAAFAAHKQARNAADLESHLRGIERSPNDQRILFGFDVDPAPAMPDDAAVYVVTHVDVPREYREEAERLLRDLASATHTVPGELRCDVYQQYQPRNNHFTLVTVWRNRAAFNDYGNTPAWSRFMTAITPLLGAPYDERQYRPVQQ